MAYTEWSVIAAEVPSAAKWNQLGDNDEYLKDELEDAEKYLVPSGGIILWSGAVDAIPDGWALCNGGSGSPDLRNRFVVGAGDAYAVNATGGNSSVTLSTAQLPVHNHSGSSSSAGAHVHTGTTTEDARRYSSNHDGSSSIWYAVGTQTLANSYWRTHTHSLNIDSSGSHSHTITVGNTGSGSSHENRPPYYALAYIMKL